MHGLLDLEKAEKTPEVKEKSTLEVFADSKIRKALLTVAILNAGQQLVGINVVRLIILEGHIIFLTKVLKPGKTFKSFPHS